MSNGVILKWSDDDDDDDDIENALKTCGWFSHATFPRFFSEDSVRKSRFQSSQQILTDDEHDLPIRPLRQNGVE